MCGIFGFSRITDVTRAMAPFLAWEMEARGKDSWGASNGTEFIRRIGPITFSWAEEWKNWMGWDRGIFHTRAASTGAVTLQNQHPFVVTKYAADATEEDPKIEKTIVGIHNGVVVNHAELNTKHGRNFECDSPHIFMAIAGFSETEEIRGYGNLAWYEIKPGLRPQLHILKFNGDNLNVFRLGTGEIVFCSTIEPVIHAARMAGTEAKTAFNIESETEYIIQYDPELKMDRLYTCEAKRKFGFRTGVTNPCNQPHNGDWGDNCYWPGYGPHHGHRRTSPRERQNFNDYHGPVVTKDPSTIGVEDRTNNYCLVSTCKEKVLGSRGKNIICPKCFEKVRVDIGVTA